jgi:hypothetical protein
LLLHRCHGRPLTERSVEDSGRLPDVIYVFQDHIEQVSANEGELVEQVRTTVLHEIGVVRLAGQLYGKSLRFECGYSKVFGRLDIAPS